MRGDRVLAVLAVLLTGGALLTIQPGLSARARMHAFPRLILWAWNRPEDLSFVSSPGVGVAYLACTILLRGEEILVLPRLQSLKVPQNVPLAAVVRIESDHVYAPALSPSQRDAVIPALLRVAAHEGIAALQIDFDATLSERIFYKDVLVALRQRLPDSMPLSITALASWCVFDGWIAGLPVDEAVPMLFRMGPEGPLIRRRLQAGEDFRVPSCLASLGVSTDEPLVWAPPGRRLYVFHPNAWSAAAFERFTGEAREWQ